MRQRRYRKKQKNNNIVKSTASWIRGILFTLSLAFAIVFFGVQATTIYGHDMNPSFKDGELVLIDKVQYRIRDIKRQDAVLLEVKTNSNNRSVVERVVGLPGETVQITDGKLYINGEEISTVSNKKIKSAGSAQKPITLKRGEYFALCDNYNSGEDSRMNSIGIIKKSQIVGKVVDIQQVIDNVLD